MTNKRLILIDLDDTLWDTWGNNKESLNELYTALSWGQYFSSFEVFFTEYYYSVNHSLWERYNREEISKEELSEARLRFPLERRWVELSAEDTTFHRPSVSADYWRVADKQFMEFIKQKTALCPNALSLLRYLHSKYRVCILSNGFGEVQYDKLELSGLMPYIHRVVLSDEVGYNKPNAKIFKHALVLMGCSVEETIMIGDSWGSDIVGASNAGIESIWYNQYGIDAPASEGIIPPRAIVCDLAEIEYIL